MGLFDGGFDMDALMKMIGPGAANAAGAPPMPDASSPNFDDRFGDSFANAGEPNPSPVAPGGVPMPRPFPGVQNGPAGGDIVPPDQASRSITLNAGAPDVPDQVPPGKIGEILRGGGASDPAALAPSPGAEGPTGNAAEIAAATKPDQRPSLAQALRGAQMPAAPVQQKISSPNAPRPTGQIKAGDLQALLLALNAAGGPGMPRPTLGGRG